MTWTLLLQGSGRSGPVGAFFILQPKKKKELVKLSGVEGTVEGEHSKGNQVAETPYTVSSLWLWERILAGSI